jgi:hypothetical protein
MGGIGSMTPKEKIAFFNKVEEDWKPSTGKHADEQLMKDFIDKGGKVEKIPENKRAYNGNRIKPHLANDKNLARQEAMSEETITEKDGANTSSRQGSRSRNAKKKYRLGYRVAEKQPKGNDLEEEFSEKLIKQAYGILNDPRYKQGNYTGAVNAIEKIAKGLAKHKDVANALRRANEEYVHPGKATFERIWREVSDKLKLKVLDRKIKRTKEKFYKNLRRP